MKRKINRLRQGVVGITMKKVDPVAYFSSDDDEDYEEIEIICPNADQQEYEPVNDVDFEEDEMTGDQKEVFRALVGEGKALGKDFGDEKGEKHEELIEDGEDMENFLMEAMGGEKPIFLADLSEEERKKMESKIEEQNE